MDEAHSMNSEEGTTFWSFCVGMLLVAYHINHTDGLYAGLTEIHIIFTN